MISIAIITQLVELALNTVSNIQARHAARESLDQGQKIRQALGQTGTNTKIYDEIVAEAKRQIAERDTVITSNLSQLESVAAQVVAEVPSERVNVAALLGRLKKEAAR